VSPLLSAYCLSAFPKRDWQASFTVHLNSLHLFTNFILGIFSPILTIRLFTFAGARLIQLFSFCNNEEDTTY